MAIEFVVMDVVAVVDAIVARPITEYNQVKQANDMEIETKRSVHALA